MTISMPHGYAVLAFDDIDSTNEDAKRRADLGERGPLWIVAKRQSVGRGRRGRNWSSVEGNLFATLLIAPGRSALDAARLSFVAALCVRDLVQQQCPPDRVRLKWPNDVLIDGRKCAGILLESVGEVDGVLPWIAVGIGVNLASAPENTEFPATSVAAHGTPFLPEVALSVLADRWNIWFQLWQARGFAPIRAAWLASANGLGVPITARLPQETITGTFDGLDMGGRLIVRLDNGGIRMITSGEVFFGAS